MTLPDQTLRKLRTIFGKTAYHQALHFFSRAFEGVPIEDEEIFECEIIQLLMQLSNERREKFTCGRMKNTATYLAATEKRQRAYEENQRKIQELIRKSDSCLSNIT